jgi:hypothetical protein
MAIAAPMPRLPPVTRKTGALITQSSLKQVPFLPR